MENLCDYDRLSFIFTIWTAVTYSIEFLPTELANTNEYITAMVVKSVISWDITPCSPLIGNWRFEGTFRVHLEVEEEAKEETSMKQVADFLLALFFDPEDGGDMFLRNISWLITRYTTLHPKYVTAFPGKCWDNAFI
jgi:hypothetical protein